MFLYYDIHGYYQYRNSTSCHNYSLYIPVDSPQPIHCLLQVKYQLCPAVSGSYSAWLILLGSRYFSSICKDFTIGSMYFWY